MECSGRHVHLSVPGERLLGGGVCGQRPSEDKRGEDTERPRLCKPGVGGDTGPGEWTAGVVLENP